MTEHAIDEWIDKAIPPGSGRYYAILHADHDTNRLRSVATLISIWSKLGFDNREIDIARRKLDWWRDELQHDACQHPITRALQPELEADPDLLCRLQDILNGYGSLLEHGSPSTDQANNTFHQLTGSASCQALCGSAPGVGDEQTIKQVGLLLSRFRCLRYLRQHVAHGLLCLPLTSLEAASLTPDMLKADNKSEALQQFLDASLAALNCEFQTSLPQLACASAAVKPLYIYARLQQKLLNAMQRDKNNLLQQEIRLSPIKNFWLAFRAARHFDKTGAAGI